MAGSCLRGEDDEAAEEGVDHQPEAQPHLAQEQQRHRPPPPVYQHAIEAYFGITKITKIIIIQKITIP
jgi:hypothetical protein